MVRHCSDAWGVGAGKGESALESVPAWPCSPPSALSPGWERAKCWGLQGFLSLVGAARGRKMLEIWKCLPYSARLFPGFCGFSLSLLDAIALPAHQPTAPHSVESVVPPWAFLLLCLCLCRALWGPHFLHGRTQDLLAQILSIQDPAQCILFRDTLSDPATIHSFPQSLIQTLPETCLEPEAMPGTGVQRLVRSRLCF